MAMLVILTVEFYICNNLVEKNKIKSCWYLNFPKVSVFVFHLNYTKGKIKNKIIFTFFQP